MLADQDPVVLLQHGGLDNLMGKTGLAMLRHRRGPIVAVIDPAHAGRTLESITGIPRPVPVVKDLDDALPYRPSVAVVGLAPSGGVLPAALRSDVLSALRAGLSVASGLHTHLADDPELSAAVQPGCWIWDLRCEPEGLRVGQARAAALPCKRVLAVGTDMAVGKMSACLAIQDSARCLDVPAVFVGTGQAGILISGQGVPLDAVRVDYAAGAVEAAVLNAASSVPGDALLLVEGQGSLCHPGSTATLPLMRGSQPTALLMVHRARQTQIHRLPDIALPPLEDVIQLCEGLASIARPRGAGPPPLVKAVALNTAGLTDEECERETAELSQKLSLPCSDPIRQGADSLTRGLIAP